MYKKLIATTIASLGFIGINITSFSPKAIALTFGEALGVGAGVLLLDKAINSNNDRYNYRPPEQEYRRGLEDGYNRVRYDNPRNSGDYDKGYTDGGRRRANGWTSPFSR